MRKFSIQCVIFHCKEKTVNGKLCITHHEELKRNLKMDESLILNYKECPCNCKDNCMIRRLFEKYNYERIPRRKLTL